MKKVYLLSLVPFFFSLLTGCTVLKRQADSTISDNSKQSTKQRSRQSANVESQLLATAQSIEESLNTLAAAEKAENMPILNTEALVTTEGGMGGTADVDWTGPLVPLVEKIAAMTDYRVKVMGNDPGIPVLVSVSAKRAVIADILQNASLQAGKKAQILVFPSSRLIEVRYIAQ